MNKSQQISKHFENFKNFEQFLSKPQDLTVFLLFASCPIFPSSRILSPYRCFVLSAALTNGISESKFDVFEKIWSAFNNFHSPPQLFLFSATAICSLCVRCFGFCCQTVVDFTRKTWRTAFVILACAIEIAKLQCR